MTDDLDELQKVAEAPTPGPWEAFEASKACEYQSKVEAPNLPEYDNPVCYLGDYREHANARYIATFDPPTVRRLIARLREEKACAELAERAANSAGVEIRWVRGVDGAVIGMTTHREGER